MKNFIVICLLLGVWEGLIRLWHVPPYLLPGPVAVLTSLYRHAGLIAHHTWPTLIEALLGFVLGAAAGVWAAMSLSYWRGLRAWFLPMLITSQALPIFAIAPLLVIWLGYGMASKIVVTMLMIFFPVASAFYDGLCRTPVEWLYLGQVMGASKGRLLWRIRAPAALPALGSGLRMAATFAPMGAVIGEWVGASRGLGFLMLSANARMQIDLLFAVLFVLVVLTLMLYFSVDYLLGSVYNSTMLGRNR
jgi:putative hydroxymethylpyrimidine transport system permease protein